MYVPLFLLSTRFLKHVFQLFEVFFEVRLIHQNRFQRFWTTTHAALDEVASAVKSRPH